LTIDFSDAQIDPMRLYGGANGGKLGITYLDAPYMLKFPSKAKLNPAMGYTNSCISEYIACHMFATSGIETQETLRHIPGKNTH
jgi:hypothetical protein